jgi:hypothetical protein
MAESRGLEPRTVVIGLGFSSQATVGASIVGFACLIGIVARIVQASRKP